MTKMRGLNQSGFVQWGVLMAAGVCFALAAAPSTARAQNLLTNPGFESPNASGGDVLGSSGWSQFNDAYTTVSVTPHSGTQALKVFGPFSQFGGAGVVQGGFAATPGQSWGASAWLRDDTSDPMQGTNFATVQLQFMNASNNVITTFESPHFTAVNPTNTWQLESTTGIAPAGTVAAQIVLVHVQLNNPVTGGSVFFDDASLGQVPEPASVAAASLIGGVALMRRRRAAR